jgi:hypothetical protein
MFLREFKEKTQHERISKTGKPHVYYRHRTMVCLRCDSCDVEFIRERGSMDPTRLNNNYFHVCSNCDAKRFGQKRGVERKQVWDMSASSDLPIGKL